MISRTYRQQWGGLCKDSPRAERPARQGKFFCGNNSPICHRPETAHNRATIARDRVSTVHHL
jgi:hypothetical protein